MTTAGDQTSGASAAARRHGPGRPRNEDLDRRVLEATLALIDSSEVVTIDRLVARSGVGKAAIYRRWSSLNEVIAAALDLGRQPPQPIATDGDILDAIHHALTTSFLDEAPHEYRRQRFQQRLQLVLEDPALQQTYWDSNISPRRAVLEQALRAGVAAGVLREDLDIEACIDVLAGIGYYQVVARGARLDDPEVLSRCQAAIELVWQGMLPRTALSPGDPSREATA